MHEAVADVGVDGQRRILEATDVAVEALRRSRVVEDEQAEAEVAQFGRRRGR